MFDWEYGKYWLQDKMKPPTLGHAILVFVKKAFAHIVTNAFLRHDANCWKEKHQSNQSKPISTK